MNSDEHGSDLLSMIQGLISYHRVLHRLEKGRRRPDSSSGVSAQLLSRRKYDDDNTTTTTTTQYTLSINTAALRREEGSDVEMFKEIEMSVEEAMDLSADEDEPKDVSRDEDEDNEPMPVLLWSTQNRTISRYHGRNLRADSEFGHGTHGSADMRLHARAIDAAASVEDKEKGRGMMELR